MSLSCLFLYTFAYLLKCIWNEIFDSNLIVLFESASKDKINGVYRLLISCLDPSYDSLNFEQISCLDPSYDSLNFEQ